MNSGEVDHIQVVLFKRDLRVHDHQPLAEAAEKGPLICLYVFEPSFWQSPESDGSHFEFVRESLCKLKENLESLGGDLIIRVGEVPRVLDRLWRDFRFECLWSHEETGNSLTYRRDIKVGRWVDDRGVKWIEIPQTGVVRRLANRDGWSRRWQKRMTGPVAQVPNEIHCVRGIQSGGLPLAEQIGIAQSSKRNVQKGGEEEAWATLNSFLLERGVGYRKEMSSPLTGEGSCSRLSPYLAWGNISIRQAYQATRSRAANLREIRDGGKHIDKRWLRSLGSFESRLRWHCHFMQKFEDQPSLEFENMNRAFDGLREDEFREDRFEAWCRGETGYPMVDACMRALHDTGWINFRMRAMLVSFASYHLWLHWRRPAVFLARHFLDYEPGIHFSQFQMQAGVTGINTLRIYSPAKQVIDQDPEGEFLRRYCPELEGVAAGCLPEPHLMSLHEQSKAGCRIGRDYPEPIVDHREAYSRARKRMGEFKARPETKEQSERVQKKHGSRRKPARNR